MIMVSSEQGHIELCVQYENTAEPVPYAHVDCFLENRVYFGDYVLDGDTESNGCIALEYAGHGENISTDIYCEIKESDDHKYTKTEVLYNWNETLPANFGTIYVEEQVEKCVIGEVEVIDVFTDWRKMAVGALVAALLTLPAVSVYYRETEEKPMKSYLSSCLVKFSGGFFSMSLLLGIFVDCKQYDGLDVSFSAAILVELIEFIFDIGRLVIFFSDPGTLDFYQNVRWNSRSESGNYFRCFAMGMSSLPLAALMLLMWVTVLISQFSSDIFQDKDVFNKYVLDLGFGIWFFLFAIFAVLASSCMGGYYLLRMVCPCVHNEGEDKGRGFYWSQFKLVALDIPSLISTGIVNPSALVFFWTAEFINDMFPTIACYFIEKYLEEEEEVEVEDILNEDEDLGRKDDEENKQDIMDLNNEVYEKIIMPLKYSLSNKKLNIMIEREFPSLLNDKMNEEEWIEFCDKIDSILDLIAPSKEPKPDRCIKIMFIILAMLCSFLYWIIGCSIAFMALQENENVSSGNLAIILIVVAVVIGGYICIKNCFSRDVDTEMEIVESLVHICDEYNDQPDTQFRVNMKNNILTWLRQGSLSCKKGVNSIDGIECLVKKYCQCETSERGLNVTSSQFQHEDLPNNKKL